MSDKQKVELIPAFFWHCPDCSEENFSRAIVPEFSLSEENELKQKISLENNIPIDEIDLNGQFLSAPQLVNCSNCKKPFETVNWGIEEDTDEDEDGGNLIYVP